MTDVPCLSLLYLLLRGVKGLQAEMIAPQPF